MHIVFHDYIPQFHFIFAKESQDIRESRIWILIRNIKDFFMDKYYCSLELISDDDKTVSPLSMTPEFLRSQVHEQVALKDDHSVPKSG